MVRELIRLAVVAFVFASMSLPVDAAGRLKIYLMIGQSNMEGQAYAYHIPQTGPGTWNVPTIEDFVDRPATLDALPDATFTFANHFSPNWLNARNDVWGVQYRSDNGAVLPVKNGPSEPTGGWETGLQPLQPGMGLATTGFSGLFGAELAMGQRLGDALNDPVLLFKSSKGGTNLGFDWRPPSAAADRPTTNGGSTIGVHYTNTINRFKQQLDALDADLADDGKLNDFDDAMAYDVAGVVWLQGWNTTHGGDVNAKINEYTENLVDLIEDIRASDSRIADDAPLIVVESSDQSGNLNQKRQDAVDAINADKPGTATFIETNNLIGVNNAGLGVTNVNGQPYSNGYGYHFHARAENFLEIGWKVGDAVIANGYTGIPEPASLSLLAIGGALILRRSRAIR